MTPKQRADYIVVHMDNPYGGPKSREAAIEFIAQAIREAQNNAVKTVLDALWNAPPGLRIGLIKFHREALNEKETTQE